jgi:proline- and glutamine-rich splicing factor
VSCSVSKGDRRGGGGSGGGTDLIVLDDHMMTSAAGAKKKFTGRCRLFIGSLPQDYKDPELRELFKPFGEISECFISPRGFAFVKMVCVRTAI